MDVTFNAKLNALKALLSETFGQANADNVIAQMVNISLPNAIVMRDVETDSGAGTIEDILLINPSDHGLVSSEDLTSDHFAIGNIIPIDNTETVKKETVQEIPLRKFQRKDIEEILDLDLKIVYAKYEKEKDIDSNGRTVIAKCIIKHLLASDYGRRIERKQFEDIATAIKDIFPCEEIAYYFVPSHDGICARGKLYNQYRSYREQLAAVDLISLRNKRKIQATVAEADAVVDERETTEVFETSLQSLTFVEKHTDPKEEMLKHWINSRQERQKLLGQTSNYDYIQKFPALQMGNGFEWILIDFDFKHPDVPNILEFWPVFASQVIAHATSVKNKSENLKLILKQVATGNRNGKILIALKLLPLILNNNRKDKGMGRPSKPEVLKEFLPHFTTEAARGKIDFKDDLPHMSIIGKDVNNCIMFVTMGNVEYGFDNPILGFDACFKIFFALNCKYPLVTKHIWQFIDLALYKLDVKNVLASIRAQLYDITKLQCNLELENE